MLCSIHTEHAENTSERKSHLVHLPFSTLARAVPPVSLVFCIRRSRRSPVSSRHASHIN